MTTPTDNEIVHIVAVVAPIGDAATKTRLERTAQWFAENHRKAQQGDSVVIRFQLEWYDELSEDLTALSTRLAGRNDVVAVVGPFGNEAVNAFASACLKKNKALIAPTATRGDEIVSLGDYNGQGISCFTLNNRTLYKDGSWNTLCLLKGITAGEKVTEVRAFSLNFGENEPTGIIPMSQDESMEGAASGWFTLDGRRLDDKPTQHGVYLNGGKKFVVN